MSTAAPEILLGALAVRKGLASESDIETALDLQKQVEPGDDQSSAKVGEILLEMGTFSEDDLKALLIEQSLLRESFGDTEDPPKAAARLVQESSDAITVNGARITGPHALVQGDQVRIGESVFRFEGGEDLLLIPSRPVTPSGSTVEIPRPTAPAKPAPAPAAEPPPAPPVGLKARLKATGARTWEKTKRLFRDVTGKRAREKATAIERRDTLLKEFALAALQEGFTGPEVESARKTQAGVDEAARKNGLAAKGAIKAAQDKAERAFLKLGRTFFEKGAADPAKADELRALDLAVKDLS
jgi:pSer/pThr/pTyr-binding forkhead associated (FHA) protein